MPIMATSQITHCILTLPAVRISANNTQSLYFCCHLKSLSCCINAFLIFSACRKRYLRFFKGVSSVSLEFLLLFRLRHSPPVCTWSVLDITVAEMRWCQALSALEVEPRGESPQVDQLLSMYKLAVTSSSGRPPCFVLPAQQQSLLVYVWPLVYTFFSHDHIRSGDIFSS